jgi:phosphonate transport system permease protein
MTMASRSPTRATSAAWPSRRGALLVAILALGILAFVQLDLAPSDLVPGAGGAAIAREFFAAALAPAVDYEAEFLPDGAPPFLWRVLVALERTLLFAVAAMSLALVGGLVLGFFASTSSWATECAIGTGSLRCLARSSGAATIQVLARLVIAGARSVHELLWAIVFLAAFGLGTGSAVIAIAIPYAGVLGKVFSEILDETPDDAPFALRSAGAPPIRAFLFARLARALPDMAAYSFYRFECATRSSAVLGFFGFETLGYYIKASFDNLHYREVWTYLYAMLALVLVLELWSAAVRRRFVA